jgi:hypothetical protein
LLAVALAVLASASADACSVFDEDAPKPGSALAEVLHYAHDSTPFIYLARISSVDGDYSHRIAHAEVLEDLRRTLGGRRQIELRFDAGDTCDLRFEAGRTYLVYSNGASGPVGTRSRTREASSDDPEVQWLRTGKLPPVPVAVQREVVTCEPCVEDYGFEVSDADALAALGNQKAFLYKGYVLSPKPGRAWEGRTREGRLIEITDTASMSMREKCRMHQAWHWCQSLRPVHEPERRLRLECVDPGESHESCNEERTRTSKWEPLESLEVAKCNWGDVAHPTCSLSDARHPLAPSAPRGPVLRCSPEELPFRDFSCEVVSQASSTEDQPRPRTGAHE